MPQVTAWAKTFAPLPPYLAAATEPQPPQTMIAVPMASAMQREMSEGLAASADAAGTIRACASHIE